MTIKSHHKVFNFKNIIFGCFKPSEKVIKENINKNNVTSSMNGQNEQKLLKYWTEKV